MQDTYVFATKNYPCDGLGRYFASASNYVATLTFGPDMADISATFCGRFFKTDVEAGKWIQMHPGIFDFQKEVKKPLSRAAAQRSGSAEFLPAVGVVLLDGDGLHRTAFINVDDFAAHCDELAHICVDTDHVFFFVFTRMPSTACEWASNIDMNDYIDVRDEMELVRAWRRDQAALDDVYCE